MAKSLMMEGARRGFDVSSKAGIDQWIAAQNAGAGLRPPSLGAPPTAPPHEAPGVADRRAVEARRRKRKLAKASSRKNR